MRQVCFVLLAFCAAGHSARATTCLELLQKFIFVTPPAERQSVSATLAQQLIAQETSAAQLARLEGVKAHPDNRFEALLYHDRNLGKVESADLRTLKLWVVDSIAKKNQPRPVSILNPFLTHPDAPALLSKIRAEGYELMVDPSLNLSQSQTVAYHIGADHILGIAPWTPFQDVEHEFAHVLFRRRVMDPFLSSETFAKFLAVDNRVGNEAFQVMSQDFAARLVAWTVDQEKLSAQQIQTLREYARSVKIVRALDETLATAEDLRGLAQENFSTLGIRYALDKHYQLYWQLHDLELRFNTLSRGDQKLWAQKKIYYWTLDAQIRLGGYFISARRAFASSSPEAQAAMIFTAGAAAGGTIVGLLVHHFDSADRPNASGAASTRPATPPAESASPVPTAP